MQIIDGKEVSLNIRKELKIRATELTARYNQTIGLAVIIVGDNQASKVYVANKIRGCEETNIKSYSYELSQDTSEKELIDLIKKLNNDDNVHGILLQLPLPKHLVADNILPFIDDNKDVDGFSAYQMGKLVLGKPELVACTPLGVMELLAYYKIEISGRNAVVLGRSNIVGKPMAQLLLAKDATVTICHSRTKNLAEVTSKADILVVAIGRAKFVTKDMVAEGAVVIDVGMNRDSNNKLCGDVDFENVSSKCSYITPVPGGVGPMTITMLLNNTIKAFIAKYGKNGQ